MVMVAITIHTLAARVPTVMAATTITVYTREQCHLCADAIETIERVVDSVPTAVEIHEIDVDTDPELAVEYGERVPYVLVDNRPQFKYRVDEGELRRQLTPDG
jgi:glutaredoxin